MDVIFSTFGIDAKLIVVQLINFGLLMALLGYFLYNPILRMLNEREAKITQGLKDAENAATRLAEAEDEKAGILTEAHNSAKEVAQNAKLAAEEQAATIVVKAREDADKIVKSAEAAALEAKRKAEAESEAEIAKTAVLAAEKILREKQA